MMDRGTRPYGKAGGKSGRFTTKSAQFGTLLAPFLALLIGISQISSTCAQSSAASPDPALTLAENLAGKALFLRGFYIASDLSFDPQGQLLNSKSQEKTQDWTLSAVNILKAQRHGKGEIQLDGVRVAIRYNQDAHQFERHAHNDEPIRITIATFADSAVEAQTLERAFAAIFSVGIDPALQRSLPEFWRHYFDPTLAWPKDALTDTRIITPGQTGPTVPTPEQMKTFINPVTEHRENAKFTDLAIRDKINGEIDLRLVVDAEGIPRRITIIRPIGYGLDARAVEAVAKWRFHPATLEGTPVAATIIVREQFDDPTPPHP
jgi:TonB family protein